MRTTKLLVAMMLLALGHGASAQSLTFTSSTVAVGTEDSGPDCVAVADINGDGKLDLISANYGFRWASPGDPGGWNTNLVVLTNNGSGVLGFNATLTVGRGPSSVIAADLNGDGKPDLINANETDNTLTVLTNDGSGVFGSNATLTVGSRPHGVVAADFNRDRNLDLACVNAGANSVSVLLNQGGGVFALSATLTAGSEPLALAAADVNGDGRPDLISANKNDDTLTVLTNDGSGGFAFSATLPVGHFPDWVSAADLNGDRKPDLVSVNWGAATMTVLTNGGSGVFGFNATLGVGTYPSSVAAADFNGDGKADLICASTEANSLRVLTNNGSGVFGYNTTLPTGRIPNVWPADLNGDGKPDLACPNFRDGTVTVLLNTTTFIPPAGQPPAGLVGWWPGDGHTYDLSPSHYHATLAGTARYASGLAGQAFDCRGPDNDVLVGQMEGLHFENNFSFAAWINPRIAGISLADPIMGREGEYMMCILPNHHLSVILANQWPGWGTEYWRFVDTGFEVPINQWTHAAVVYSSSVLRIYVNGELRTSLACAGNVGDYWQTSDQFRIGGRQKNTWEYFYNGLVDEVMVFNRPLAAEEVTALYASGAAGLARPATYLPSGLISWWRGEGNATDWMFNHPGTPQGGLSYTSGQMGQAFSLNGQDAAVALGSWFNLQQFTLSLWVRPAASQGTYADILDNVHSDYRSWAIQYNNASDATRSYWHWGTSIPSGSGSVSFALTNNTWQHWVVTIGADRVQRLYLDGELAGSTTNTAAIPYDGSQYFNLGRHQIYGRYFNGLVDELMCFDRALEPAEVTSLYVNQGGRPKLNIETTFPGVARLSWPLGATAYRIEAITNLAAGIWTTVTDAVVPDGLRNTIPLENSGTARFFRLKAGN